MLWRISLYLECGSFTRENWRAYHRASDAAKQVRASGDKNWKKDVAFEHARPLGTMYQMLLDERETLTLETAACIIGEYPPVLITTKEERRMAELGFKGRARTAIRPHSDVRFQSAFRDTAVKDGSRSR